jgi:hypothetical protein
MIRLACLLYLLGDFFFGLGIKYPANIPHFAGLLPFYH